GRGRARCGRPACPQGRGPPSPGSPAGAGVGAAPQGVDPAGAAPPAAGGRAEVVVPLLDEQPGGFVVDEHGSIVRRARGPAHRMTSAFTACAPLRRPALAPPTHTRAALGSGTCPIRRCPPTTRPP